jgi:hypothetical protein
VMAAIAVTGANSTRSIPTGLVRAKLREQGAALSAEEAFGFTARTAARA